MKRFFGQDTLWVALVAGLGSELIVALLLWLGLLLAGEPIGTHLRWFGVVFVPLIFVLQHYAKTRQHLTVTRTLIIIFFLTFVAFMALLFLTHSISMK